jgi:hypothetical protein
MEMLMDMMDVDGYDSGASFPRYFAAKRRYFADLFWRSFAQRNKRRAIKTNKSSGFFVAK